MKKVIISFFHYVTLIGGGFTVFGGIYGIARAFEDGLGDPLTCLKVMFAGLFLIGISNLFTASNK